MKTFFSKIKTWLARGDSGISTVEMALVLPLFLLLVFGMIQFGLGWFYKQTVTNAAREGARMGIVIRNPPVSEAQITTRIQDYLSNSGFNPAAMGTSIEVEYRDPDGIEVAAAGCTTGCRVSVAVTVPIASLVPYFPGFPDTLTGNAVMRHE